jgi:hypothetical protein
MLIGYARVSTLEQDLALQLDALKQAGCDSIFDDTASGATTKRPGLTEAVTYVRKGDTLVVWRWIGLVVPFATSSTSLPILRAEASALRASRRQLIRPPAADG